MLRRPVYIICIGITGHALAGLQNALVFCDENVTLLLFRESSELCDVSTMHLNDFI